MQFHSHGIPPSLSQHHFFPLNHTRLNHKHILVLPTALEFPPSEKRKRLVLMLPLSSSAPPVPTTYRTLPDMLKPAVETQTPLRRRRIRTSVLGTLNLTNLTNLELESESSSPSSTSSFHVPFPFRSVVSPPPPRTTTFSQCLGPNPPSLPRPLTLTQTRIRRLAPLPGKSSSTAQSATSRPARL